MLNLGINHIHCKSRLIVRDFYVGIGYIYIYMISDERERCCSCRVFLMPNYFFFFGNLCRSFFGQTPVMFLPLSVYSTVYTNRTSWNDRSMQPYNMYIVKYETGISVASHIFFLSLNSSDILLNWRSRVTGITNKKIMWTRFLIKLKSGWHSILNYLRIFQNEKKVNKMKIR